jgi:hypothetical protein
MLYLVARFKSTSGARLAQLTTEYDPQPPFGGIDWTGTDSELAGQLRGGPNGSELTLTRTAR